MGEEVEDEDVQQGGDTPGEGKSSHRPCSQPPKDKGGDKSGGIGGDDGAEGGFEGPVHGGAQASHSPGSSAREWEYRSPSRALFTEPR